MVRKYRSLGLILALAFMTPMLNGCVAIALAPTALSLAAEGFSVHTTGQTLTENLKDAILDSQSEEEAKAEAVFVASLSYPGLPPRKPTPPLKKQELLEITTPASMIGQF